MTPADGVGPIGKGSAPAQLVSYSGGLSIDLEGRHYTGQYVQQEAGFFGLGTASVGGQVASGTVMGTTGAGGGKAYLTEPGGMSLSCDFDYSSWSATGVGFCRRSDGKTYNLMVH